MNKDFKSGHEESASTNHIANQPVPLKGSSSPNSLQSAEEISAFLKRGVNDLEMGNEVPAGYEAWQQWGSLSAPLLKVTATLEVQDWPKGFRPSELRDWLTWGNDPGFPCGDILLIGRYIETNRDQRASLTEKAVFSIELYLSQHFREDKRVSWRATRFGIRMDDLALTEALQTGLGAMLKKGQLSRFEIKDVVYNPGMQNHPKKGLVYWETPRLGCNGPQIALGISNDWGVRTCCLTGKHFWSAGPLGFYYQGDLSRPVSPDFAGRQGVTLNSKVLRVISKLLSKKECVEDLNAAIEQMWWEWKLLDHEWTMFVEATHPEGDIDETLFEIPEVLPKDIIGGNAELPHKSTSTERQDDRVDIDSRDEISKPMTAAEITEFLRARV